MSAQLSVPPPSTVALPTVWVVVSRAAMKFAEKPARKPRFRVVFVVVAPYVRIRRGRVRAVLGAVPLPGGGLTVQPLPHVGKGPTVIAVTAAVAVAVAGFDSVKAFQRNNALRNQGHSAGRVARVSLVGDFSNDRLTVVKRACIFDQAHRRQAHSNFGPLFFTLLE